MAFWDWIRGRQPDNIVEKTAPPPQLPPSNQDPVGLPGVVLPMNPADRKDPNAVIAASFISTQETPRQGRYTLYDSMDQGDIAAMLDAVVDAAVTFDDVSSGRGFKVQCADPNVDLILQAARQLMQEPVCEAARDMCKYGDAFAEPVFDQNILVKLQTYEPREIFRNQDDKGRLAKGKDTNGLGAAFQQRKLGQFVAGWQPWEMTHFRLYPEMKLSYSRKGLLDDISPDWQKLQLVEQAMIVGRVMRAYPKRKHYIDMTNKTNRDDQLKTLRDYIRRMTNTAFGARPTDTATGLQISDVGADIYIPTGYMVDDGGAMHPQLNKVETDDPSTSGITQIRDVEYFRQKLWSRVPSDYVGIRRNTAGTLDSQDLAFARLLRKVQHQLEIGIRQILDQVLLASGRVGIEYKVIFPQVVVGAAWLHSDARFRDSMTARNHIETGVISRRFAAQRSYNLTDEEVDAMWADKAAEDASGLFGATPALSPPNAGGPIDAPGATGTQPQDKPQPASAAPTVPTKGALKTANNVPVGTPAGKNLRGNFGR